MPNKNNSRPANDLGNKLKRNEILFDRYCLSKNVIEIVGMTYSHFELTKKILLLFVLVIIVFFHPNIFSWKYYCYLWPASQYHGCCNIYTHILLLCTKFPLINGSVYDVITQNASVYKNGVYTEALRVKFTTYTEPLVRGFFVRELTPLILSEPSLLSLRHTLNTKRNSYNL